MWDLGEEGERSGLAVSAQNVLHIVSCVARSSPSQFTLKSVATVCCSSTLEPKLRGWSAASSMGVLPETYGMCHLRELLSHEDL